MLQGDSAVTADNCGHTLLTIVARGTAIITEINRLVDLVPGPLKQGSRRYLDREKKFTLDSILFDFSYFKNAESYELIIESNEALKKADEEFCEQYSDILTRFYLTFESIQRYTSDLNRYINDIGDEVFVGQSLDGLLADTESRQLLCEAFYNLGYMLLTIDDKLGGDLRERLMVAYYRYSSYRTSPDTNLDETCNLLRSTNFVGPRQLVYKRDSKANKGNSPVFFRPDNYPESYFSRVQINQSVVNLLIAKLQSVDIYNQTNLVFPHPDHRSNALSQQASILYILLYFCPNILKHQKSRMREIADKFFHDNWIINLSMGELVNLVEAWEPYKAARESIVQILDVESVKNLANQFHLRFFRLKKQLDGFLQEGWLKETTFLENHSKLLNCIREGNVILKWMLLHSKLYSDWQLKLTRTLHSIVIAHQPDTPILCNFLQNLANLERISSNLSTELTKTRPSKLEEHKTLALDVLDELISIYNNEKPMRWLGITANSRMGPILVEYRSVLNDLNLEDASYRDHVIKLVNSLESAREAYSDGKSLQVVQLFAEVKANLLTLLRYYGLNNDLQIVIQSASDFSYAWRLTDEKFTQHLQQMIKEDPLRIQTIEAIFLKLASASDSQLLRMQQLGAQADLISVSQYYSSKLVTYIRNVLHVIPATILELLSSIVELQTGNSLGDMPSKIPLDNLKDYIFSEQRAKMLELTYKISHFAEGMMLLQDTTIGLIQINSKQLLEDGIRRELVQKLTESIQSTLRFPTFSPSKDHPHSSDLVNGQLIQRTKNLINKLTQLTSIITSYKRSFEYIQDYLFIYGLRMWQEELSRIVKFNVEQATCALLDHGNLITSLHSRETSASDSLLSVFSSQYRSRYQSNKAPIPVYDNDPLQSSFVVRILQELLQITSPQTTIFDEQTYAWYDQRSQHKLVVDLKIFDLINASLSVSGLNGLDQLCCSLLVLELQRLHNDILELSSQNNSRVLRELLGSLDTNQQQLSLTSNTRPLLERQRDLLDTIQSVTTRMNHCSERLLNQLTRIGQLQAIRISVSYVLSTNCRYDARHLHASLQALNTTLLSNLKNWSSKNRENQEFSKTSNIDSKSHDETEFVVGGNAALDERIPMASSSQKINLEDSQVLFETVNHLEWIGLHEPLDKMYTLNLERSEHSSPSYIVEVIFILLVAHSSRLLFTRSISGLMPSPTKNKLSNLNNLSFDAQPLFYGIVTLMMHSGREKIRDLIGLMSSHVRCSIDCAELEDVGLSLQTANEILSMTELLRLSGYPTANSNTANLLPKYIFDTFQFTVCHLR